MAERRMGGGCASEHGMHTLAVLGIPGIASTAEVVSVGTSATYCDTIACCPLRLKSMDYGLNSTAAFAAVHNNILGT